MSGYDQLSEDQKNELINAQVQFVEFVLIYSLDVPNVDIDELGEKILSDSDLDLGPYLNFRAMRLALQPLCDVESTLLDMEKHGIRATHEMDADHKAQLEDLGFAVEGYETWPDPEFFVGQPVAGKKLVWEAELVDFLGVVVLCERLGIMRDKKPSQAREDICQLLLTAVEVDFEGYPDIEAVYTAMGYAVNVDNIRDKSDRLQKASQLVLQQRSADDKRVLSGFMVQASYNAVTGSEFAARCPELNPAILAHVFNLLFVSELLLLQVLGVEKQ
ncbi:hypothetical protein [Paraflavitalea pollutisoli]|uniref:hypothetical protein n=1 Tax=Paraflavitalea pollutisoli TaxID=3034143 RepID=UPI0023EAA9B6|nr:hypothetical protein [Paraflavitalea sp. H1-2-19X]